MYYYGCDSCFAMNVVPQVEVLDFKAASAVHEAQTILRVLFDQRKRQLTREPWVKVIDAVAIEFTVDYQRQWCGGKESRWNCRCRRQCGLDPVTYINHRRAVETCVHLLAAAMVGEVIDEIYQLERMYVRFIASVGLAIIRWLVQLQALVSTSNVATVDDHHLVEHYRRWLLRDASAIQNNPNLVLGTGSAQPKNNIVHQAVETVAVETPLRIGIDHDKNTSSSSLSLSLSSDCIGSRVIGGCEHFDALLSLLSGHTGQVTSMSWSPDATRVVLGSGDNTVRVWEVATCTEVLKLEGHTGVVQSVSWSPDAKHVLSRDRGIVLCVCGRLQ